MTFWDETKSLNDADQSYRLNDITVLSQSDSNQTFDHHIKNVKKQKRILLEQHLEAMQKLN